MNIDETLKRRYINIISSLYSKYTKSEIIRQIRYELTDFNKYSVNEFMIYNDIIDKFKYYNIFPLDDWIVDIMENMVILDFNHNNHINNLYEKYGHYYVIDMIRQYFNTIKLENDKVINRILDYMEIDKLFIPSSNGYGLQVINIISDLIDFNIGDINTDVYDINIDYMKCNEIILDDY
jgi:hypothetical protein